MPFIHPTRGETQEAWQVYEERNDLLKEKARLLRRVEALTAINKLNRNRLRKLASGPRLATINGAPVT